MHAAASWLSVDRKLNVSISFSTKGESLRMSQSLDNITVDDGYMRGSEGGFTIEGKGVSAVVTAKVTVQAKTVTNIMDKLKTSKQDFSSSSWEKIEKSSKEADASFFFGLLDVMVGENKWENTHKERHIQDNKEAKAIMQALNDADTSSVTVEGNFTVTSQDSFPITVFVWVHLTQYKQGSKTHKLIADHPDGKAADTNGSTDKVSGSGKLNIFKNYQGSQSSDGVEIVAI